MLCQASWTIWPRRPSPAPAWRRCKGPGAGSGVRVPMGRRRMGASTCWPAWEGPGRKLGAGGLQGRLGRPLVSHWMARGQGRDGSGSGPAWVINGLRGSPDAGLRAQDPGKSRTNLPACRCHGAGLPAAAPPRVGVSGTTAPPLPAHPIKALEPWASLSGWGRKRRVQRQTSPTPRGCPGC